MPAKHNYMLIMGQNHQFNREIIEIFQDRYKPIVENNITKAIHDICLYQEQLAVVIIDDSMGIRDIKAFLNFCMLEHLDTQMAMFLLDGTQDDQLYNEAVSLKISEVIRKPYRNDIFKTRVLNLTELFKHKYRLQWLVDTQTEELKQSITVLNNMRMEVLETLGTLVEFRSFESGEHIYRVRFITDLLMHEFQRSHLDCGITEEMIHEVCMASILHDIGKISVSDTILNKPGKLTYDEFEQMKKHTEYGCQILRHFKGLYTDETYHFYHDIVRYHHEKWDGKGYPDGLKGNQIPIWAQIVSVADIYDALTNERIYKPPYNHDTAVYMIFNGECGMINPEVLECFRRIETEIQQVSENSRHIINGQILNIQNEQDNLVLHNLEKERAYHRAYTELITQSFFEYDSEYHTYQHFNMLGRTGVEHFHSHMFSHVHPNDVERFRYALSQTTATRPTIQIETRLCHEFGTDEYIPCLITIRTTWDIYTKKRTGGVGKIEVIMS